MAQSVEKLPELSMQWVTTAITRVIAVMLYLHVICEFALWTKSVTVVSNID